MISRVRNILSFINRVSKGDSIRSPFRALGWAGGAFINPDTAMKVSAYHRGVIYISTQVGKLSWVVKDNKNNTLDNDAITYLLNLTPNSEMSAFFFKLMMIQCAIHHGNGYAEIERNVRGQPVALWPLNPDSVELARLDTGRLVYKILGGDPTGNGLDAYLNPRDIFHVKNFHTKDGLLGQGMVAYMCDALGISLGGDRLANGLFANGALPSGVLKVKGTLSDEAYDRLKKSWEENHSGKKVGGIALLEEGADYSPISIDPEALQMLESRKFSVLEIARFLGLPPTKLFDTDASTYSNTENANLEVATDTLDAWVRNLEMEADIKLLNSQHSGRKSVMNIYDVFRGDMDTRAKYFSSRMQMGTITPNQVRMAEGEAPYVGGDEYYISTNNLTPSSKVMELIDAKIEQMEKSSEKSSTPDTSKSKDGEDSEDSTQVEKAVIDFLKQKTE